MKDALDDLKHLTGPLFYILTILAIIGGLVWQIWSAGK